jgi:segregation and condensation protein A
MTYTITLDQFSGPLDLLLYLIEKEELDISRISLAKVTDEFLKYLENFKGDVSEIADFLYIAAKLIYIKSTILIPFIISQKEEEEVIDLERKLQIYKEFREATKNLKKVLANNNILFSREKFFLTGEFFIPPKNISIKEIYEAFGNIVRSLEREFLIVKKIKKRIISVAEKIEEMKKLISKCGKMSFCSYLEKAKTKTEIIVSFLAILELMKRKIIEVKQNEVFGEILVVKIENGHLAQR